MLFRSGVLTDPRGSVGGLTYQGCRGASVARARHKPADPAKVAQSERRHTFGWLRSRWREVLTQDERDGWDLYARATPARTEGGVQRILTGEQMYVKCGSVRALVSGGGGVLDTPPKYLGQCRTGMVRVEVQVVFHRVGVTYRADAPWRFETGSWMLVWQSQAVNGSVNRRRQGMVYIGALQGNPGVPPPPIFWYVSPLEYELGQRVWVRTRVSAYDGRVSSPYECGVIVVPGP